MQIPTDIVSLLQSLGSYSFASDTPSEIANKLQTVPGSSVDKIFASLEILYAFREQLNEAGLTCLAQLAGFGLAHHWDFPQQAGRMQGLYDSAMGALGQETLPDTFVQPDPVIGYRLDGLDWREHILPDIDQLKSGKKAKITALMEQKESEPCSTPFGVLDNDDKSKIKLNGAATMAMLATQQGQPFSVSWTMHDNSVVTCDATKMIQLGEASGAHVMAVHAFAQALKAKVDAVAPASESADDLNAAAAQIAAIDIASGWPA